MVSGCRSFRNLGGLERFVVGALASQITIVFGAIIAFYVQLFFCHRLWALSHNLYIMVIAITLFVLALVAAIVATRFYSNLPLASDWYACNASGFAMGGELLQTSSIVFCLLRHSRNVIAVGPIATMLNSLLRATIQSAAPSAVFASISFVAVTIKTTTDASSLSLGPVISAIPTIMLPKLYGIAAVWTLNARQEIRAAAVNEPRTQELKRRH
ncbi:hypothetical protein C8R45DRAFT_1112801 [Mycena sanguinolenta]|nr:hypothetical protein C8R45DRAFT_1112801 [Mycena sanguinolenta]